MNQRIDIYSYYASVVLGNVLRARKDIIPTVIDINHSYEVAEAIVDELNKLNK